MGKKIDITGKRFGKLTAIKFDHSRKQNCGSSVQYWLFKCDCGKEKVIQRCGVVRGRIVSCGCQQHRTKHGMCNSRLHTIWHGIKQRCLNPKNNRYKYYGKRGITIFPEWEKSFISFYNWSVKNGYNDTLSIDRIDVNGDYCPENCRWATEKEQKRNTRKNRMITYKGETLCLSEMSEKYGINFFTAHSRLKRGKSVDDVFKI